MGSSITEHFLFVIAQIAVVTLMYSNAVETGMLGTGDQFIGQNVFTTLNATKPSGGLWGTGYYEIAAWFLEIANYLIQILVSLVNSFVWVGTKWGIVGPLVLTYWGAVIALFVIRTVAFGGD